jgi:hypothetical protein
MKRLLLLLALLPFFANAQTVTITKVELAGEKVVVHYNLENSNSSQDFLINLYGSKDNFNAPLSKVTGDVGPEVKPGTGKKIEWKIRDEYGPYKGKLALEIRGKVYVPVVKLQDFNAAKSFKRGNPYDVVWKPGNTNPVNIELFSGENRVQGDMTQPNDGNYTLLIPSTAKPGKDYRLKFTDSKNGEDFTYSPMFKVVPKIPMAVKILVPALVAGGIAAAVLSGGSSPENSGESGDELPLPPTALP